MQLPLTPPAVLVALLTSTTAGVTPTAHPTADEAPAHGIERAAETDVQPPTPPCPAYLGPQCNSRAHEQWVTGQDIVDLANLPLAA
jgi:hypothetical protein